MKLRYHCLGYKSFTGILDMVRFIKNASIFFIMLAFIASASPSMGDQALFISKEQSQTALKMLSGHSELRLYCAPCQGDQPKSVQVKKLEASYTGTDKFWEILLNGNGIDLAYTYFFDDGAWRNVAISMKLEGIRRVPETISENFTDELEVSRGIPEAQTIINACWVISDELRSSPNMEDIRRGNLNTALCLEEEIIKHMDILVSDPLEEIKQRMKKLRFAYGGLYWSMYNPCLSG